MIASNFRKIAPVTDFSASSILTYGAIFLLMLCPVIAGQYHWQVNQSLSLKRQKMTMLLKQQAQVYSSDVEIDESVSISDQIWERKLLDRDDQKKYDNLAKKDIVTERLLYFQIPLLIIPIVFVFLSISLTK